MKVGLPLSDGRPVVEPAAAGRRVAPQLPGDRRRRAQPVASNASKISMISLSHFFISGPSVSFLKVVEDLESSPEGPPD
jgi:hypothetical protein